MPEQTNPPAWPQPITLAHDCEATLLPWGQKVRLAAGERVVVLQALGGSFTVQPVARILASIAGPDADALGLPPPPPQQQHAPASSGPFELARVVEQLKNVFDPEIPVNVVDLGLIYACDAHPLADGTYRVEIKMSMTAPGCGMSDLLKEDVRARALTVPGVAEVTVEIIWDPPWDQSRMSEAARLQLGMY